MDESISQIRIRTAESYGYTIRCRLNSECAYITCKVAIQAEFHFTEYAEEENIHGACV